MPDNHSNDQNIPPPPPEKQPKIPLTQEARKILHRERQERAAIYRKTVKFVYSKINETAQVIAFKHQKRVCRVCSDLGFAGIAGNEQTPNAWNAFIRTKAEELWADGKC